MTGLLLENYLNSLPGSWSSYPENKAHRDVLLPYLNEFPSLGVHPACPKPLQRIYELHQQGRLPKYVQEVEEVALVCLVRDQMVKSDEQFIFLAGRLTANYAKTGLFGMFLKHIPVKMMVITASSIWERAHLSTQFRRQATHAEVFEAVLQFPPQLFPPLVLRALTRGMQVMLSFSGLKAPHAALKESSATHAHIVFTWQGNLEESAERVRT